MKTNLKVVFFSNKTKDRNSYECMKYCPLFVESARVLSEKYLEELYDKLLRNGFRKNFPVSDSSFVLSTPILGLW